MISIGYTGGGLGRHSVDLARQPHRPVNGRHPPTGRTVAYPGASFVQVEGDKIRSEKVYFDRQTVAELLGLKAK
jgi:ketosteroid isomerase-like protein